MSSPRLIFHCKDPNTIVPESSLLETLEGIGFTSQPLKDEAGKSYTAGEHFIDLLTFLGCSPVINLSAEDGDKYCYIELLTNDKPVLIHGQQPFQPRCRGCREPIKDWQEQLNHSASIVCRACGKQMGLEQVNWKQSAGYASQFIIVHNIYLHEAVPGEKLMMTLEGLTDNQAWNYFYAL